MWNRGVSGDVSTGGWEVRNLDLRVPTDQGAQLLDELGFGLAGEGAPVNLHGGLARDHVDLVAGAHDGGAGGVREVAREDATLLGVGDQAVEDEPAEQGARQAREHQARRPGEMLAEGAHEPLHRFGLIDRQARGADTRDGLRGPDDRAVWARHRAVARLAGEAGPHPDHALFGDLDGVEGLPPHVQGESADLAEHVLGAHEVRVLVDQEVGSLRTARLLVGDRREDHVARERDLRSGEQREDRRAHGDHVLHVDGPASPDVAIDDLRTEGVVLPFGRVGLDHVQVAGQEQRRRATVTAHARDETGPSGLGLEQRGLDARLAQPLGDTLGGGPLVARRVDRRDAHEVLEQLHAARAFGVPVEIYLGCAIHSASDPTRGLAPLREGPTLWVSRKPNGQKGEPLDSPRPREWLGRSGRALGPSPS